MSNSERVIDRRRVRRVSDDRILDAATLEFAAHGFAGASMQLIADGARTTKATIYANLGDKDRLYEVVVNREATALRQTLLSSYAEMSGASVPDQLHAGIAAIFRFAAERPAGFRLILGGVADSSGPKSPLAAVYREVVEAITEVVRPRVERTGVTNPNAPVLIASMLVGMFRSAATAAILDGAMDAEAATVVAQSLAEHGLRGLEPATLSEL